MKIDNATPQQCPHNIEFKSEHDKLPKVVMGAVVSSRSGFAGGSWSTILTVLCTSTYEHRCYILKISLELAGLRLTLSSFESPMIYQSNKHSPSGPDSWT